MRLIDADELARSHCVECTYYRTGECLGKDCDWDSIGHIREAKTIDAIPVGYIDQVIEEYSHLIECYLYEDNEDYKTMLYYRSALNDLKRRWKRDRPKLRI